MSRGCSRKMAWRGRDFEDYRQTLLQELGSEVPAVLQLRLLMSLMHWLAAPLL
jgi:hypothetical protein